MQILKALIFSIFLIGNNVTSAFSDTTLLPIALEKEVIHIALTAREAKQFGVTDATGYAELIERITPTRSGILYDATRLALVLGIFYAFS